MAESVSLADVVARCDEIMSHAWMVRAFVKHCEEAEDNPELLEIHRAIFDMTRALETRLDDPAAYLNMLRKKIGKLRAAAGQFADDAAKVSLHTNFAMAVKSIDVCVRDLEALLKQGTALLPSTSPKDDATDA